MNNAIDPWADPEATPRARVFPHAEEPRPDVWILEEIVAKTRAAKILVKQGRKADAEIVATPWYELDMAPGELLESLPQEGRVYPHVRVRSHNVAWVKDGSRNIVLECQGCMATWTSLDVAHMSGYWKGEHNCQPHRLLSRTWFEKRKHVQ